MSIEKAANILRRTIAEISIPNEITAAILPKEYADNLLAHTREDAADEALEDIDRDFFKQVNIKISRFISILINSNQFLLKIVRSSGRFSQANRVDRV